MTLDLDTQTFSKTGYPQGTFITIAVRTLPEGSEVFDVILYQDGVRRVRLCATSEKDAET